MTYLDANFILYIIFLTFIWILTIITYLLINYLKFYYVNKSINDTFNNIAIIVTSLQVGDILRDNRR